MKLILLSTLATMAMAQSAGTFTATGSIITPRANHKATLLASGKVLITGGLGPTGFSPPHWQQQSYTTHPPAHSSAPGSPTAGFDRRRTISLPKCPAFDPGIRSGRSLPP